MRILKAPTLKRKLMAVTLLTSGLALLLTVALFVTYEIVTFRGLIVGHLGTLAELAAASTATALDHGDTRSAYETLSALRAQPRIIAAAIFDKEGRRFAEYLRNGADPAAVPTRPGKPGCHYERGGLVVFSPVQQAGKPLGTVFLKSDMEALYARSFQYFVLILGGALSSLIAACILSLRLQRVVSDPVLHLAAVARGVAAGGDYTARAAKTSDDEVGQLIDSFNAMLVQIQERDTALEAARNTLEHHVEERTRELAGSVALLNATLESTADGIVAIDHAGKLMSHNQRFAALFEVPAELLRQGNSQDILACAANRLVRPAEFLKPMDGLSRQQNLEVVDLLELKDGRIFERVLRLQRVGDKHVGVVLNFRDVTDRQRSEAALRASERRFRSVWDNSIEGMRLTDADGLVVAVNEAYCEMVRAPREKLIGFLFSAIYAKPGPTEDPALYRGQFQSGQMPARAHASVTLWNEEELELEISSSFIETGPQKKLVLCIFRNVTERKRTEAQLKRAQEELVQMSRLAGRAEVATSVLHNVGNVLNSVNTSASLIADRTRISKCPGVARVAALLEENRKDLSGFLNTANKADQLISYLRGLAQALANEQAATIAEANHLRRNIEHIKEIVAMQQSYAKAAGIVEVQSIPALVEDALSMHVESFERHQVRVVRQYHHTPEILIDRHKAIQILVNLITNAKHALSDSPALDRVMTLTVRAHLHRVQIAVQDNGVGIAPENMTRIFAHGFTTRRNGHGFGLHSGALAAKEMGGALLAHSEGLGKGATFTLELPIRTRASELASASP